MVDIPQPQNQWDFAAIDLRLLTFFQRVTMMSNVCSRRGLIAAYELARRNELALPVEKSLDAVLALPPSQREKAFVDWTQRTSVKPLLPAVTAGMLALSNVTNVITKRTLSICTAIIQQSQSSTH